jgi:hypothetical protein
MSGDRLHYVTVFRFEGADKYAVWYCDNMDGILLTASKHIATFPTEVAVEAYVASLGHELVEGVPSVYDFDHIAAWVTRPSAESIDCSVMLNAWNMLADIANSVSCKLFEPPGANVVYDKLFWGNNIELVTPQGERYEPTWSTGEPAILAGVLSAGLSTLRGVMMEQH